MHAYRERLEHISEAFTPPCSRLEVPAPLAAVNRFHCHGPATNGPFCQRPRPYQTHLLCRRLFCGVRRKIDNGRECRVIRVKAVKEMIGNFTAWNIRSNVGISYTSLLNTIISSMDSVKADRIADGLDWELGWWGGTEPYGRHRAIPCSL
jgi:hypothetical protein